MSAIAFWKVMLNISGQNNLGLQKLIKGRSYNFIKVD